MKANNLTKLRITVYLTIDLEKIDDVYHSCRSIENTRKESLKNQIIKIESDKSLNLDQKQELIEQLSDDAYCLEETTELAGELVVIALYKTFEIAIKNALSASKLFEEKYISQSYKFNDLEKLLNTFNINIRTFLNFKEYDELRLINNSIKHAGIADEYLSNYKNFIKDEKLKNLHSHYDRLKIPANEFIVELRESLLKIV